MTWGRKTGGRDFQPGQSGNPAGRVPVPDDLRAARRMTQEDLTRILSEYLELTKGEIMERSKDAETPALELVVGSIIAKAVSKGDQMRLDFLLKWLLGNPPKESGGTTPKTITLSYSLDPDEPKTPGEADA